MPDMLTDVILTAMPYVEINMTSFAKTIAITFFFIHDFFITKSFI